MPEIVTSAQGTLCLVNGRVVGRITRFAWTRKRSIRRVQGVDQLHASELVPGPVQVSGQLGLVKVRRDGGAVGAGLLVPDPDLTQEQYVTLALKDRATGTLIIQINQCLVDSEGWSVEVRGLMTAAVSFEGVAVVGEVNPARR